MALYDTTRQLATYRAASGGFAAAADTKAFFMIEGSSTKDVIVNSIVISGATLTTVEYNSILAKKFSSASAGGTATALTKVPVDSSFPTATANTVKVYTAVPTDGTLVGTVAARRVLLETGTAAGGSSASEYVFNFCDEDGLGIVLRGTGQGLGLAFGANPGSAVTLSVEVVWKES